jgi:hypothetical protein
VRQVLKWVGAAAVLAAWGLLSALMANLTRGWAETPLLWLMRFALSAFALFLWAGMLAAIRSQPRRN